MTIQITLTVFFAMALTDYGWAVYISKVQAAQALSSATWSVVLFLMGSIGIVAFTTNIWYLLPAAVGAFVGTYLGVKYPIKL